MKGYIAALKDGFGFIETMAQDGEIFFHSSSLVGDFSSLEVGQEVEYVVSTKGSVNGKHAADMVKPLPKGSIGRAAIFPEILTGIVVRPVRGANPDQLEYTGLIEGTDGHGYPYGIISMLNKKEVLAAGDTVEFQLDAEGKPVNIRAIRKKLRATVEAVKGQYGFLSHELEDGKKLFFHMSEVRDHSHLNPGDEVEFVILQNPRNGKSSACSVVKLGESQRPERLLNRLSKMSIDETAPRLIVVRQPYGPDGTRGFNQPRVTRKPGFV
jgi:cold shock CspA family protein